MLFFSVDYKYFKACKRVLQAFFMGIYIEQSTSTKVPELIST